MNVTLTHVVVVPAVDGIVVVAGDGGHCWSRHRWVGVGRHMGHRGVGQELHDHAHVLARP